MYIPIDELLAEVKEMKGMITALQTTPQQIEVIDRPELLKRLAITEPTAIAWGRKKLIPEMRIGSNVRYNWPAVVASLETANR